MVYIPLYTLDGKKLERMQVVFGYIYIYIYMYVCVWYNWYIYIYTYIAPVPCIYMRMYIGYM